MSTNPATDHDRGDDWAEDDDAVDQRLAQIAAGTFLDTIPADEPVPPPITRWSLDASNRPAESFLLRPGLIDRLDMVDNYDLAAPYQRGSVWTVDQRRALILSYLRKIPTGSVILATQPDSASHYYRVVDGVQRITTLRMWDRGEFAVPGWWWRAEALADGEAARRRMVTSGELSTFGIRSYKDWLISTIETDAAIEFVEVPKGTGTTGSARQYKPRRRTPDERLAYEAELYGLINGGGTPQTAEDMARAERIAKRARVHDVPEGDPAVRPCHVEYAPGDHPTAHAPPCTRCGGDRAAPIAIAKRTRGDA